MNVRPNTKSNWITSAIRKPDRILAIDPGTKIIGYADFEGKILIDFGLKSFESYRPIQVLLDDIEESVQRLICEKHPNVLILEKNRFSQITQNIRLMLAIGRIKGVAGKYGIRLIEYAPNTVRAVICNNGNATKLELAKAIVGNYPELRLFVLKQTPTALKSFFNITDAIACGRTYLNLLAKNR